MDRETFETLVVEALGQATGIPHEILRRAMLFTGDATQVAELALSGGADALSSLGSP